jgi:hypothetical protein
MVLELWVIERACAAAAIGGEREIVGSFGSPLGCWRGENDPKQKSLKTWGAGSFWVIWVMFFI